MRTHHDMNGHASAAVQSEGPRSIEEAGGNACAYSLADMRRQVAVEMGESRTGAAAASHASMLAELAKQGLEPVRR